MYRDSECEDDSAIRPAYKIILLGKGAAGKTKLLTRYIYGKYFDQGVQTMAVDFSIVNKKTAKFSYYDTAGQEVYRSILNIYFKGSNAAMLIYDRSSLESFKELEYYYQRVMDEVPDCFLYVVACKSDLEEEVSQKLAMETYPKAKHLVTSAKLNTGVQEAFTTIENDLCELNKRSQKRPLSIILPTPKKPTQKKPCCNN